MPQLPQTKVFERKSVYDLSIPANKTIILEFEKFLKDLEVKSGELKEALIYYGRPHFEWRNDRISKKGINSFIPNERVGYVFNPILGLVHWSVVDYCSKNNIIHKRENGDWTIVGHVKGRDMITPEWDEFNIKRIRLQEIKSKRDFAKKKQLESLESVVSTF